MVVVSTSCVNTKRVETHRVVTILISSTGQHPNVRDTHLLSRKRMHIPLVESKIGIHTRIRRTDPTITGTISIIRPKHVEP